MTLFKISDQQIGLVKDNWSAVKPRLNEFFKQFLAKFPENQAFFKSHEGKVMVAAG